MTRHCTAGLLAALLACAGVARAAPVRGEQCRPPTPPERAAFLKLHEAVRDVVEAPLLAGDWQVQLGPLSIDDLTIATKVTPARPLTICSGRFEVRLRVDPASRRGKELQRLAEVYQAEGTGEGVSRMFQIVDQERITIRLATNVPYLRTPIHGGKAERLDVAGPDLAYRVRFEASDELNGERDATYLCYGNWQKTLPLQSHRDVPFPFVHTPLTPFIENMCVILEGPAEVTDPVVKSTDWNRLKGALTR